MHFKTTPVAIPARAGFQDCALYARLDLDADVFVDGSELEYEHWLWGTHAHDLELPRVAVDPRGSVLLLSLADMGALDKLSIPLHARYPLPKPADQAPVHRVLLPRPTFFWGCLSEKDGGQAFQPFANASVEVQSPISPHSILLVANSPNPGDDTWVELPTGQLGHWPAVDLATKSVVLLMALWLTFELVRLGRTLGRVSTIQKSSYGGTR